MIKHVIIGEKLVYELNLLFLNHCSSCLIKLQLCMLLKLNLFFGLYVKVVLCSLKILTVNPEFYGGSTLEVS